MDHFFLVRRFFYFLGIFYLRFSLFYSFTLCFRYNLLKPSYLCFPPYFRPYAVASFAPSTAPSLFSDAVWPYFGYCSSYDSESLLELLDELSLQSSPFYSRITAFPYRPVTILWQFGIFDYPNSYLSTFYIEILPKVRGIEILLKTLSSILLTPPSFYLFASSSSSSMIFSNYSSSLPLSMPRATMNWKRCQSEKTFTLFLLKKSLTLVMSLLKKSSAWGWSCSTDCETSMTQTLFSWQSMLYQLRSAWMSLHYWYKTLIIFTTYRQIQDHCSTLEIQASLSRGAFFISFPMKSITRTLDLTSSPTGLTMTPYMRFKFLSYFYAHMLTIFRGLLEQYPLLNLNSPSTQRSLSLKTRIEVLYIFMAYYFFVGSWMAWYTFASFPVERQPFISVTIQLLINFSKILRVRQSKTCQTVARSALSFVLFYFVNYFCQHSPISLLILCKLIFVSNLVYVFQWYAFVRPFCSVCSLGVSRLWVVDFFQKYSYQDYEDSLQDGSQAWSCW